MPSLLSGGILNTVIYFAYGSNMQFSRIINRVPNIKKIDVGILYGYKLLWHKRSKDGSGKL